MYDTPTLDLPPVGDSPPKDPGPRRRRLYALIAVVAALLLVVPVGLYYLLRADRTSNEAPGPVPSATVSAVPGASAAAPPATVSAQPGSPVPDGKIAAAVLKNATLHIPAWPADNLTGPSGRIKFTDGEARIGDPTTTAGQTRLAIYAVFYGDVDHDGAAETVAAVFCGYEGGSTQLVAFDRNAAAAIVTIGTVVSTTGEIRSIDFDHAQVLADGIVQVRVGDYQGCCGDETPTLRQTRGYRWNGRAFAQVTGPATFPVNPAVTETGVTAGELVLGPASGGIRRGILTVGVTYTRGARPASIRLSFYDAEGLARDGTGWPAVGDTGHGGFFVTEPTPQIGTTAVYTFAFSGPATGFPDHVEVWAAGLKAGGDGLGESNPFNNDISVPVRASD